MKIRNRTSSPYDWRRQRPQVEIRRPEVDPISAGLGRGDSYVLLAGRGMGKSVFLYQLQKELEALADLRVVLFAEPPPRLTVEACLEELSYHLGVTPKRMVTASDVVAAYFEENPSRRLVLLFDEFDRYARTNGAPDPPGRDFFNSLESMHRVFPGVGILAAGSIGVFVFRDVLGSSFLDRADKILIRPFDREQIEDLARPFADRGETLSPEAVEALDLASGGNPALVTYALGALWPKPAPSERDVIDVFIDFQVKNSEFVRDFQLSFSSPRLSEAPQRIWDLIQSSDGMLRRADLATVCGPPLPPLLFDFTDVLTLLEAAGLVKVTGSVLSNPVLVHPISSILSLPRESAAASQPEESLREALSAELQTLLARLHVSSVDFFRPGSGDESKRLVPESVFSAFLALGFQLLGWQVDREAQRVVGQTDLLIRRPGSPGEAVVEVKIWGRNDFREVQKQVESYCSADTVAAAVVTLTDAQVRHWPQKYRESCLAGYDVEPEEEDPSSPVRGPLKVSARTLNGMSLEVDHFLLRLPRGRA